MMGMRIAAAIAAMMSASAALADSDLLNAVPAMALAGRAYPGDGEPARIRFINTRSEAVRIDWIATDGSLRAYALLNPGQEYIQPTYVTHRWMVESASSGAPIEAFIATRAALHEDGTTPIALIR